ncbi:MFS transporter [Parahaliea mediterranea]|uniref:MFS transporter n=1 Tax=Parahaliea mediterranea TaxID=651086 RepID=UPI000E2E937B|nr:MFS transporter [Parahaliea mediterranea]
MNKRESSTEAPQQVANLWRDLDAAEAIQIKPCSRQVVVIALCLLFNIVDGFDITVMAVAAKEIGAALSLDESRIGLLFSFALAGMMVGGMLIAPVADILGRRKVIIGALCAISFSVLMTALSRDVYSLIALRFVSGLGAGALLATQASLVSEFSTEKYRTLTITLVTAGYPLGAMTTGIVAGVIMPVAGWKGMFLAGGAVTAVLTLLAIALIPESLAYLGNRQPEGALQRMNAVLRQFNRPPLSKLPETADPGAKRGAWSSIRALFEAGYRKKTLVLWLVFCCCSSTLYFLMSWIPKLVTQMGFDDTVSYSAYTIFSFGGVLGILVFGMLSARYALSSLVGVFMLSTSGLMLILSQVMVGKEKLLLLILLTGFMLQSAYNALYAVAAKLYATNVRATGVGWALGMGRLGAVIAPAVAGFSLESGVTAQSNFIAFSIPLVISGMLVFTLRLR